MSVARLDVVELASARVGLALWAAAIVWWGLGDLATTHVLWHTPGFVEQSPIVATLLGIGGTPAHATWKAVMLGSLAVYYRQAPPIPWCPDGYARAYRLAIPAALAARGAQLTLGNWILIG